MNEFFLPFKERRRLHDRAYRAQQRDQSEVCGAIVADRGGRIHLRFLENTGDRPGHFEMRTRDLKALRKEVAGTQQRVVGVFHSHVVSKAVLGSGDLHGVPVRYLQLVYDVCGRTVRLWRVMSVGSRRRAKEVPIALEPRPRGRCV